MMYSILDTRIPRTASRSRVIILQMSPPEEIEEVIAASARTPRKLDRISWLVRVCVYVYMRFPNSIDYII